MEAFLAALQRLRELASGWAADAIAHLPSILGALSLILFGWLVARLLRRWTLAASTRLNRWLDRVLRTDQTQRLRLSPALVRLSGNLVFWVVVLGFITAAAEVAKLDTLSRWLERLVGYLPQLFFGVLIMAAGFLVGGIVRDLVYDALASVGVAQRSLIGKLAQAVTVLAAIVIGIDQIGIDVTFVTTMLAIVLGGVVLGFALAFGLGTRRVVANLVASHSIQRQFCVGQRARIGNVEGEILDFTPTGVVLATEQGRTHVPASRFDEQSSVLLSGDTARG
jgi:small-conductance mechanosensitive channel